MKHEMKLNGRNYNQVDSVGVTRIHFEYTSPTAESVYIAGTFNGWHPDATRMIYLGGGHWAKDLALPPGSYEYCLVVDGKCTPDPLASEAVPNPFGGLNSVRRVGGSTS